MTNQERRDRRYARRKAAREKRKTFRALTLNDVFSYKNIVKAQRLCWRNVGWKASTIKNKLFCIEFSAEIYQEIHSGKYRSKGFVAFNQIERGKLRHILSVRITERIVQKCLCIHLLNPALTYSFIYDNGASQKGKGIDFAKERFVRQLREYYQANGTNEGYCLSFDIHAFFDSIRHEIIKRIYGKITTDPELLRLLCHFVDCFAAYNKKSGRFGQDVAKGLGLGSEISQLGALAYLNAYDHRIKEFWEIKGYERYSDDGRIIHRDKSVLLQVQRDTERCFADLKLELNAKKTQIVKLSRGVLFLKERFVLKEDGEIVRMPIREKATRERRRLKKQKGLVERGKMTMEMVFQSAQAWASHLLKTHCANMLSNMRSLYRNLFYRETQIMIKTEHPYVDSDGVSHDNMARTYSDEGLKIYQASSGAVLDEAVDVYPNSQIYYELPPADEENDKAVHFESSYPYELRKVNIPQAEFDALCAKEVDDDHPL